MAIDLKEAVSILEGGDWCEITFITANVKKGTGGKVIVLDKCRIARGSANVQTTTAKKTAVRDPNQIDRNPNHNLHFTRNVQLMNKDIISIHPLLITHINKHTLL